LNRSRSRFIAKSRGVGIRRQRVGLAERGDYCTCAGPPDNASLGEAGVA
jgi:hypothetical protein